MTTLHSGGKFDTKVYETSGGLHGVGVSVVNALSEKLEVEVARGQQLYRQSLRARQTGVEARKSGQGPEPSRYHRPLQARPADFRQVANFDAERLFRMARSKAYLFGGVEIRWLCDPSHIKEKQQVPEKAELHFPGGLKDFLEERLAGKPRVADEIFSGRVAKPGGHGSVEWAVAWFAGDDGFISSYCNTIPTIEGGTHEQGFRQALTRSLRSYGELSDNRRRRLITAEDAVASAGAHAVGVHSRARIPGPDQGEAGDGGCRAHRRTGDPRSFRSLAHRSSGPGRPAARMDRRSRRGTNPPPAGEGSGPQERGAQAAPARQAGRLCGDRQRGFGAVHRRGRFGRWFGQAGA